MKKLFTCALVISSVYYTALCQTANEMDIQSVNEVINKSSKAFADRNIDEWSNCYVQDERFTHIGYEIMTIGFKNLKEGIKTFFEKVTISDPKISELKVYISGDVAWATFINYWVSERKDNKKSRITNGYTTLGLIKNDGKWKILRYHETAIKN